MVYVRLTAVMKSTGAALTRLTVTSVGNVAAVTNATVLKRLPKLSGVSGAITSKPVRLELPTTSNAPVEDPACGIVRVKSPVMRSPLFSANSPDRKVNQFSDYVFLKGLALKFTKAQNFLGRGFARINADQTTRNNSGKQSGN